MGRGTSDSDVGPLVDAAQHARVDALVGDALRAGARCELGGRPGDGPGYFYEPTVLSAVPSTARVLREEIFGPVVPIRTFRTEAEVLATANDGDLGLAAYVFTRDLERAMRVVEQLEAGMVAVNRGMVSEPAAPFGGVKQSGLGREGGVEGIDEYLALKVATFSVSS